MIKLQPPDYSWLTAADQRRAVLPERWCDCSQPAVLRNGSGYLCRDCLARQRAYDAKQGKTAGVRPTETATPMKVWDLDFSPIAGASLAWLDRQLALI